MVLCDPELSLGGKMWWKTLKKNDFFFMQQHKTGLWVAPPFRILLTSNHIIAQCDTRAEIESDWEFINDQTKHQLLPTFEPDHTSFDETKFVAFFHQLWVLKTRSGKIRSDTLIQESREKLYSPKSELRRSSEQLVKSEDCTIDVEPTNVISTQAAMANLYWSMDQNNDGDGESKRASITIPPDVLKTLQLPDKEEFKAEDECFLMLGDDLIPGKILVTEHFICFYDGNPFPEDTRLNGYLTKRGKLMWRRRFCELRPDGIYYYESADSSHTYRPQGIVKFDEFQGMSNIRYDGRQNSFEIRTLTKNHIFSADSSIQQAQWMKFIRSAVHQRSSTIKLNFGEIYTVDFSLNEKKNSSLMLDELMNGISIYTAARKKISFLSFRRHHVIADALCMQWKGIPFVDMDLSSLPEPFHENDPFRETFFEDADSADFRNIFQLEDDLVASFWCASEGKIPGTLYLTNAHLCFYSKILGTKKKVIIPLGNIKQVQKDTFLIFHGIKITTLDYQEIFFGDFWKRDAAFEAINLQRCFSPRQDYVRDRIAIDSDAPIPIVPTAKPDKPLRISILTIGSRGDVQPYLALAQGLAKDGHTIRIITHAVFKDFVESYGFEFYNIGGDPKELMDLCVRNGMFTASFIKEALGKFRGFVDEVLRNSYQGCLGSDAMIAAPNVMSAYHVAEKLKIPFFGAFTMPYTKTSQYPHAFAVPETPKGQMYNTMTHVIIQSVFWQPIRGQVNQFRGEIGLPSIGAAYGDPYYSKRIPFLYCFSPLLVPKPPDWGDEVNVCGYWFLESPPSSWTPPEKLLTFIAEGTEPPIYIGFGSIVVADPDGLTQAIFQAVSLSKTRAIVVKGWGGLGNVEVPDNIYLIDSVPHEWLFPQMRAVVHHGGAGTTAAGLRFGKPTIIVPFFGTFNLKIQLEFNLKFHLEFILKYQISQ
eukprot:TRINITY_DN9358_c0_g1_i3.p1 TRINITY_DN9358_c0_g1~~TRINITY_DN9358_c0_g1_i3.p1  ORF type:complete len:929 (-),score=305.44 TRINITY_DN9358_c0_g1_i3:180-2966(-)